MWRIHRLIVLHRLEEKSFDQQMYKRINKKYVIEWSKRDRMPLASILANSIEQHTQDGQLFSSIKQSSCVTSSVSRLRTIVYHRASIRETISSKLQQRANHFALKQRTDTLTTFANSSPSTTNDTYVDVSCILRNQGLDKLYQIKY